MQKNQIFNTNSELDFPVISPTLDLDFSNSNILDPRINFTRSSSGSYLDERGIIRYAGNNTPRFDHDPETGESLGLLFEESRTNIVTFSQNFNTWVRHSDNQNIPSIITVNETNQKSPDNISNFFLCTYGNRGNDLRRGFPGGQGKTYTASCFFKRPSDPNAADRAYFQIHIINGGFTRIARIGYNFRTNTLIDTSSANTTFVDFGFKRYPNDVVRIWIILRDDGQGTGLLFLNLRGAPDFLAGRSILTWGAQIEEGVFPTSYIPTGASQVTRMGDNALISGKNFADVFNSREGTIFLDHRATDDLSNRTVNNNSIIYNIVNQNSALGNFYNTFSDTVNVFRFGVDNDIIIRFADTIKPPGKSVFTYNADNDEYQPYIGGKRVTDISNKSPYFETNYDRIQFAPENFGKFNGHIKRFSYYNKYIPNSQLQSLTL